MDGSIPGKRRGLVLRVLLIIFLIVLPPVLLLHRIILDGEWLSPADLVHTTYFPWRTAGTDNIQASNPLLSDQLTQTYPWAKESVRCIRRGELPLWNPLAGAGAPLLANQGSAVLAPWNFLLFLISPEAAQGFLALGTLILAGGGMFLLLRSLHLRRGAALFGATAFSLSGVMVVWVGYPQARCASFLPLALFFTERLITRRTLVWTGFLGLVIGLVWLGGHLETGVHVVNTVLIYGLSRIAPHFLRSGRLPALRSAGLLILGLAVGTGAGAAYVLPALDLLCESAPGGNPGHLSLDSALTLLLPGGFGSPVGLHANYWGPLNYNEGCAYFGILPLLFLFLSPLGGIRKPGWAPAVILGILAAVGAFSGHSLFRVGLPPALNASILDCRLLLVLCLAGTILGAMGLDQILQTHEQGRSRRQLLLRLLRIGLPLGGIGLVGGLISLAGAHPDLTFRQLGTDPAARYMGLQLLHLLGILASGLLFTMVFLRGLVRHRTLIAALWILSALDLGWHAYGYNPTIKPEDFLPGSRLTSMVHGMEQETPPPRFLGFGLTLPPNLGLVHGWNDVRVYDPTTPRCYRELLEAGIVALDSSCLTHTIESPILDLLGVRYICSYRPLGGTLNRCVGAGEGERRSLEVDLAFARGGATACLFTRLENAAGMEEGAPVARIVIRSRDGVEHAAILKAGVHTAEGDVPRRGEPLAHSPPHAAFERWTRDRNGGLCRRRVHAMLVDLRRVTGDLDTLTVEYLAEQGRLHLERFSPGTEGPTTHWGQAGLLKLKQLGPVKIYENTGALDRARIVHEVEAISDTGRRLARLTDPDFDQENTLILEKPFDLDKLPGNAMEAVLDENIVEEVRILRYLANEVELEAILMKDGFVVLSDLFLPGWKATVQGREWQILRANHALRAIPLKRGGAPGKPYRIRLRYEPEGFQTGLWLTLAAGLILLFLLLQPYVTATRVPPSMEKDRVRGGTT